MGGGGGSPDRWPHLISGVGVLLGAVLIGEVLVRGSDHAGFRMGAVTSAPFILGLIYGGYWIKRSDLPPDRYGRIASWWVAGLVPAVLIVFVTTSAMRTVTPNLVVAMARWGVSIGGSLGLLVGVFEARAVTHAVEAETARIRQQEIRRERDRLEEFADVVSHDLRSPLTVASGRLDLLREDCDGPHLDEIEAAHDRMYSIIEDTLTLARAGQVVGETAAVELSDVATRCWEAVETDDATLRTGSTATIEADEDRLRHVFENLFRNAVEHGGEEPTRVRVGSFGRNGFYVEDDGSGIPESERSQVFESGYTTSSDGSGLGLDVVETIADAHGWEVAVTESESGGARFEIMERDEP
jgi:signal transduction histidine kinase